VTKRQSERVTARQRESRKEFETDCWEGTKKEKITKKNISKSLISYLNHVLGYHRFLTKQKYK